MDLAVLDGILDSGGMDPCETPCTKFDKERGARNKALRARALIQIAPSIKGRSLSWSSSRRL